MQMRLASLVIMDDGLHDIFLAIAICQKIVCCAEKVVVVLLLQILRCCYDPASHNLYVISVIEVQFLFALQKIVIIAHAPIGRQDIVLPLPRRVNVGFPECAISRRLCRS